jgi:hypothetical protein
VLRASVSRDQIDDALHRGGWHLSNVVPAAERQPAQMMFMSGDGARLLHLVDDSRLGLAYVAASGAAPEAAIAALAEDLDGFETTSGEQLASLLASAGADLAALARAVGVLALTADPSSAGALQAFESCLRHPDERVRALALNAVAYAPWPGLVETIADLARSDPSPPLRAAAGQWCALLGGGSAAADPGGPA